MWLCMHIYRHILWKVEINLWDCPLGWPPTLIFEARSLTLGLADSAWLANKPRKTSGFFLPALENQSRSLWSLATSQCRQQAESDGRMLGLLSPYTVQDSNSGNGANHSTQAFPPQ